MNGIKKTFLRKRPCKLCAVKCQLDAENNESNYPHIQVPSDAISNYDNLVDTISKNEYSEYISILMWSNYFEDDDSNADDEWPTTVSMTYEYVEDNEIDMVVRGICNKCLFPLSIFFLFLNGMFKFVVVIEIQS